MAISVSYISAEPKNGANVRGASKAVSVLCTILLTVPTVLLPYRISFDSHAFHFNAQTAWAKDGNKGGGNGNGNANGQGGGNGNGNANGGGNGNGQGGANGNGNANGKGGANGNDNAGAQSGAGRSAGNRGTAGRTVNQSATEARESVEIGAPPKEVQHANGMTETIVDGRYVMKDAKGRTIINRKATPSDQTRLQSFAP